MMYSKEALRSIRNYQVNLVIKILIFSDFIIWSSYQLFAPIFAIFITDKINGSIEVVGVAWALFFLTKSIFEIPVGVFIDKKRGETDDLITAFIGTLLSAFGYFLYVIIASVWQLYLVQILLGFACALAYPGWYSIFTRHVDKGKEAFEWSLYDVLLGLGMAGSAALGAFIADFLGFDILFIIVGILTLLGALSLILIKDKIYKR